MAPPKGHPRYGGRVKGRPSRRVLEFRAAVEESGLNPVEYMLRVMRDPNADPDRRDRMAAAVAPFVHPRLNAVDARVALALVDRSAPAREMTAIEFDTLVLGAGLTEPDEAPP